MNGLGLIGRKLGMTSIFTEDGKYVPVTVIQAGPCPVMQVKAVESDGYDALQLGFAPVKPGRQTKAQQGHQEKSGAGNYRHQKEFRPVGDHEYELGQMLDVEFFKIGERVKISGRSKGRGFSGVMKRWNYQGQPASHGHHKVHRSPGAIGQCADPARVFKGKKMAGQMGDKQVTVSNVEIIDVRKDDNVLLIKGQIPGHKNSVVMIRKQR
ncbi:MAG: 50S ribosomal protein L3 [Desulfovermiculus sp.]|nr:50S ribosomal protein L3 [Desulfovermiculus sp.]